jgi:EAL domain-containing protein (putative c-di-GMP-specific phosphodiesterase class I)
MQQAELYQSVLRQLSLLPVEYLKLVEQFVSGLNQRTQDKKKNRQAILALAGSWSDLSEEDFEEILTISKQTGASLFSREIDL